MVFKFFDLDKSFANYPSKGKSPIACTVVTILSVQHVNSFSTYVWLRSILGQERKFQE